VRIVGRVLDGAREPVRAAHVRLHMISDVEAPLEISFDKPETKLALAHAPVFEREDAYRAVFERRTLGRLAQGETDKDGRFAIDVPAASFPEKFRLSAVANTDDSLSGPGAWLDRTHVHDGSIDAGDLVLRALHRVTVSVRAFGQPVDAATVKLGFGLESGSSQEQWETTVGGVARFDTLRSDHVHVTVEREGFATEFRDVATSAAEARVEVDLETEATVSGQVRDAQGQPVPGARVRARETATHLARFQLPNYVDAHPNFHFELAGNFDADENGRYSIHGLAAGRSYTLEASKWDQPLVPATLEVVPPNERADLVLAASCRIDVEVELVAKPKQPNGKTYVSLEGDGATWTTMGKEVDATHWKFEKVAAGVVRVAVAHKGLAVTFSEPVTLAPGESAKVRLEVGLGRAVSGRVLDPSGSPLAKVAVIGPVGARFTVTRADGRFEIDDLPLGACEIQVEAQKVVVPAGVSSIPDVVHEPLKDEAQDR
jgi:protocatechuate 3,4-dioxygenase beta subunit